MSAYALADRLGITLSQVLAMTLDEWHGWIAYCKLTAKSR